MPSRRLVKDPERYKTVLCATWVQTNECPYGRKCQFAHGRDELRTRTANLPLTLTPVKQQPHPPQVQMPMQPAMHGGRPPLPSTPMSLWPQQPQPGSSPMQPAHLERGLLLSPAMGVAPPLPPGPPPPPPTQQLPGAMSDYQAVLTAQLAATNPSGMQPPAQTPPRQLQQQGAGPSAVGMALDCPYPLLPTARVSAPGTAPPLPSAILSTPPTPPQMSTPGQVPCGLLPLPAAQMAPGMAPPPPQSQPLAFTPPPVMAAPARAPATAPATAPSAEPLRQSSRTREPLAVSDEFSSLGLFAMKCAIAPPTAPKEGLRDQTNCFPTAAELGALWSPLRLNDGTGKVEVRPWADPACGSGGQGEERLESPIEPMLSKRDVSYSTQMVRRAVSFVFADGIDDGSSPLGERKSPHTAIAA